MPKIIEKLKSNFVFNTFSDLALLFKNFLNWISSAIVIFLWSLFVLLVLFYWISFVYSSFVWAELNLYSSMFWNIVFILFIIIFFYTGLLFINLYNSYINWNKLKIRENKYFSFKLIIKYFKLSLLNIAVLFIPLIIFLFLIFILYLIAWGMSWAHDLMEVWKLNYLSITSLVLFVVFLISVVYLYSRLIFSYFILLDENNYKEEKSTFYYMKESLRRTKWVKIFLKLLTVVVIFLTIYAPINYLNNWLEHESKLIRDYIVLSSLDEKQLENLNSKELYYYESLKLEFKDLENTEIATKLSRNSVYLLLFLVFNFIFFYSILIMILNSFYRKELNN